MNQCDSSATHKMHLESGWKVKQQKEIGDGDSGVSVVQYTNGSVWVFDNVSAAPQEGSFDETCNLFAIGRD